MPLHSRNALLLCLIPLYLLTFALFAQSVTFDGVVPTTRALKLLAIFLHFVNASWVFLLLQRAMPLLPSLLGAVLFVVHPLQTEAILNFSQGMTLGTFFAFTYIGLHPADSLSKRCLSLLALSLAVHCHPAFLVAPLVSIALSRDSWRAMIRAYRFELCWSAALGSYLFWTRALPSIFDHLYPPRWAHPFICIQLLYFYLSKLFFPSRMAADYALSPEAFLAEGFTYLLIFFLLLAFKYRALWKPYWGALAVTAVALFPFLGWIRSEFQLYSYAYNQFFYFAMIGPALGVATLVARAHRITTTGMVVALLGTATFLSHLELHYWKDRETLMNRSLALYPMGFTSRLALAEIAESRGNLKSAIEHLENARTSKPKSHRVHLKLTELYDKTGNRLAFLQELEMLARLAPNVPQFHLALKHALEDPKKNSTH